MPRSSPHEVIDLCSDSEGSQTVGSTQNGADRAVEIGKEQEAAW